MDVDVAVDADVAVSWPRLRSSRIAFQGIRGRILHGIAQRNSARILKKETKTPNKILETEDSKSKKPDICFKPQALFCCW